MNYAAESNIGLRAENQDFYRLPEASESTPLIAVSDGMGGHNAGALASRLTIDGLVEQFMPSHGGEPITALRRAISHANLSVYRQGQSDPIYNGMGATLVCALLFPSRYIVANIGDSRLYHYDGNTLDQVTTDHSYVEMLVQGGHITREEARSHPKRNVITRSVGLGMRMEADIFDRSWKRDDILLLCSDGLHGSVESDQIADILSQEQPLSELCARLVRLALLQGASDNITVALARCSGGDCA